MQSLIDLIENMRDAPREHKFPQHPCADACSGWAQGEEAGWRKAFSILLPVISELLPYVEYEAAQRRGNDARNSLQIIRNFITS